jgi:hypothetical protein
VNANFILGYCFKVIYLKVIFSQNSGPKLKIHTIMSLIGPSSKINPYIAANRDKSPALGIGLLKD